jgi:phosphoribosyl-AMP cyclohydrolase / phosphoribosyl-ATP pyrophosphohydrolase
MDPSTLDWEKMQGLIPAVIQDAQTGRVLMLGFMNRQALDKTLETGLVTFWSRSRKELWCKGETSENYLRLKEVRTDCDRDALVVIAEPMGPTCHRGTISCFGEDSDFSGLEFLGYLEKLVASRKRQLPAGSYTTKLFQEGLPKIAKKLGEEAVEVVVSAGQSREDTVQETADLLYHLLVFLSQRDIPMNDIVEELKRRHYQPRT